MLRQEEDTGWGFMFRTTVEKLYQDESNHKELQDVNGLVLRSKSRNWWVGP